MSDASFGPPAQGPFAGCRRRSKALVAVLNCGGYAGPEPAGRRLRSGIPRLPPPGLNRRSKYNK
jgi:hypothetical protein